jgi:hypothetical protein
LTKQKLGRILDLIIKYELLLLAAGIPMLVLPRSYLWKWQQGLSAYAPLGGKGAGGQGGWGDGGDKERRSKGTGTQLPNRLDNAGVSDLLISGDQGSLVSQGFAYDHPVVHLRDSSHMQKTTSGAEIEGQYPVVIGHSDATQDLTDVNIMSPSLDCENDFGQHDSRNQQGCLTVLYCGESRLRYRSKPR